MSYITAVKSGDGAPYVLEDLRRQALNAGANPIRLAIADEGFQRTIKREADGLVGRPIHMTRSGMAEFLGRYYDTNVEYAHGEAETRGDRERSGHLVEEFRHGAAGALAKKDRETRVTGEAHERMLWSRVAALGDTPVDPVLFPGSVKWGHTDHHAVITSNRDRTLLQQNIYRLVSS